MIGRDGIGTFRLGRMPTPIGTMLVVFDDAARVRAIDWSDFEPRMLTLLRRGYGPVPTLRPDAVPRSIGDPLDAYFAGGLESLAGIAIAPTGTAFQQAVWDGLRTIPAGTTLSYGALAVQLGQPKAVRAVGLANGANPIGVVVPCHRVIGADGRLTGYGGGLHRKHWLLAHEGAALPKAAPQASFAFLASA